MGPLQNMIQSVMNKKMQEEFPQVQLPAVMQAKITRALPVEDTILYEDVQIADKNEGRSFMADVTGKWYEYSLKILTKTGDTDTRFPEIPGVKSKISLKAGDIAAVMLLYGDLRPFIVGEVR